MLKNQPFPKNTFHVFLSGYYPKKDQQKELNEKQTVGKVHKFRPALHRNNNNNFYMKSVTISEGFHIALVFQARKKNQQRRNK